MSEFGAEWPLAFASEGSFLWNRRAALRGYLRQFGKAKVGARSMTVKSPPACSALAEDAEMGGCAGCRTGYSVVE
jgi:hypothetical protein